MVLGAGLLVVLRPVAFTPPGEFQLAGCVSIDIKKKYIYMFTDTRNIYIFKYARSSIFILRCLIFSRQIMFDLILLNTFQEIIISHLGKKEHHLQICLIRGIC